MATAAYGNVGVRVRALDSGEEVTAGVSGAPDVLTESKDKLQGSGSARPRDQGPIVGLSALVICPLEAGFKDSRETTVPACANS